MIQARLALTLLVAACWNAWQLLAGRLEQGAEALIALGLTLVVGLVFGWRQLGPDRCIGTKSVVSILLLYVAAVVFGTPLIQIGVALCGCILVIHAALGGQGVPLGGLAFAVLLMPVLPTIDFFLAWPMRRLSAVLTAAMLRLNGFPVGVEGVAISWHGQQLLFDGPCSGVKMLWAALLLASLLTSLAKVSALRTGIALMLAALLTIPANAIRAASLFFVETGFLPPQIQGLLLHEAVGLSAFGMLASLMFWRFRSETAHRS